MAWWQYLILANLYLILFYGFYAFLLRRETFFQLNRVYLVASAVLSFIIPVIQADWLQNLFITRQVKTVIYNGPVILYRFAPVEESISIGEILAYIYLAGISLLAAKLVYQFIKLKRLTSRNEPGAAYSFFKKIKISRDLDQSDIIAAHEEVHARQWHSVDVLLIEVISIICWFNPVVYLYRNTIKHIHEFIADSQVVNSGADKADYAMLLLSHTLNAPAHQLVNPFFNNSLLKQRIIMLQKSRSARVKLLKYGLSAPLFAAMLILSSATVNDVQAVISIKEKTADVLETPITEVRLTSPSPVPAVNVTELANKDTSIKLKLNTPEVAIDTVPKPGSEVFTQVEEPPMFPGGSGGFAKYLGTYIRYPAEARNKKIAGRVIVNFIVEKDGSLTDIKVLRGIGGGCDEEAVRVLKNSPKWTAGKQSGKAVRVQYTVPIQFDLATDEPQTTGANKPAMLDAVTVVGYATPEEAKEKAATELKGNNNEVTFTGYALAKKKSTDEVTVIGLGPNDTLKNSGNFTIKFRPNSSTDKALVIIDGKESSYDYLSKMDVKTIESISVLKDNSAAIYGSKGKNGVLLITTKKSK